MGKSLNLWYSRVTSVQSCSYTATQMSSYSCPGTGDFGSMPSLEKKKNHSTKKKLSGSSGQRCFTEEHCMVEFPAYAWLPKAETVTGQVLSPHLLMDLLVCMCQSNPTGEQHEVLKYFSSSSLLIKKIPLWSFWVISSITKRTTLTPRHPERKPEQGTAGKVWGVYVHFAKGQEGLKARPEQFPWLEMSVEKMSVLPEWTVYVCLWGGQRWNHKSVIQLSATPEFQAGVNSCMLWVQSCGYYQQGGGRDGIGSCWETSLLHLWKSFENCSCIIFSRLSPNGTRSRRLPIAWRKGVGLEGSKTPASNDVWG